MGMLGANQRTLSLHIIQHGGQLGLISTGNKLLLSLQHGGLLHMRQFGVVVGLISLQPGVLQLDPPHGRQLNDRLPRGLHLYPLLAGGPQVDRLHTGVQAEYSLLLGVPLSPAPTGTSKASRQLFWASRQLVRASRPLFRDSQQLPRGDLCYQWLLIQLQPRQLLLLLVSRCQSVLLIQRLLPHMELQLFLIMRRPLGSGWAAILHPPLIQLGKSSRLSTALWRSIGLFPGFA
jgi:hypothetical protein